MLTSEAAQGHFRRALKPLKSRVFLVQTKYCPPRHPLFPGMGLTSREKAQQPWSQGSSRDFTPRRELLKSHQRPRLGPLISA